MGFYSLVPFEGEMYLIKATESQALTEEQLQRIDAEMKAGKRLDEMQELLDDVWTQ